MNGVPLSPNAVFIIRDLASRGLGMSEIAREMGLNPSTIWGACKRHSIACLKMKGGPKPRPISDLVPTWVPECLRSEYLEIARDCGEEAAASRIRKLKAEAARC